MYLKKALWAPTEGEDGVDQSPPSPAVSELVSSLNRQRLYREVTLALRTGLRDARADFSFLRVRGLRNILKFLRSVAESEATIRLFLDTQSIPQLQDGPYVDDKNESNGLYSMCTCGPHSTGDFRAWEHSHHATPDERAGSCTQGEHANTLRQSKSDPVLNLDHIFSVEPMQITSPATDCEVALALRVLEGCCLLNRESTALAHQQKAIKVLLNILSTHGILEQGACLDALISIMLDSSANQMDFEACHGIDKIAELIKDKQGDENIRLKCGEFLLLLIGHVNGRDRSPMATIHEDIRRLLGEKSASLIWAASQFGSTLDPEQRLTALHIQARRVLESLELY